MLRSVVGTVVRSVERSPVLPFGRNGRSGAKDRSGVLLEVCVDSLADHCAHTTDFTGALLLIGAVTEGIHLILENLKGVASNDSPAVRAFERSLVRAFGLSENNWSWRPNGWLLRLWRWFRRLGVIVAQ